MRTVRCSSRHGVGEGVCQGGSVCPDTPYPPLNRITDRCKNITFPQLLLWTVKIEPTLSCYNNMVTWLTLVIVRYSDRCIWIQYRRHRYEQIYSKDLVAASPPNVALKQEIKVLRNK